MLVNDKDCFHIHTYRCRHADNISDDEYIKTAINIGATGIWFTDHAPFPGDPFKSRMRYSELDDYLYVMSILKEKYGDKIIIHVGLEIEYFPSFDKQGYYQKLLDNKNIEILLLGQHMAEVDNGYTFSWNKDQLNKEEYIALGNAEIQGIKSGYFKAVAHPDRIFKRQKTWSEDMQIITDQIVQSATDNNVYLEQNESSKAHKYHFWNEFWENVNTDLIIHGLDAHSLKEIKLL